MQGTNRTIRLACTALVFVACAGTTRHTPAHLELARGWPAASSPTPVAVRPADVPSSERSTTLAGLTFVLDLREYTHSLADRVAKALASQGVALDPASAKSLELEVVYARITPAAVGNMHCLVDFTVRAGNGYVHGHQARASSLNPTKACNAALSEAAAECLRDPQVLEYLAGP